MIKRECAKNPQLKNESWDKFMPKYVSKNVKKQKKEIKEKKEYTPFPPPQQPSKVDLQLGKFISVYIEIFRQIVSTHYQYSFYKLLFSESGEYFIKEKERKKKKNQEKVEKQEEAERKRKKKRLDALQAPAEKSVSANDDEPKKKKKKLKLSVDLEKLKGRTA